MLRAGEANEVRTPVCQALAEGCGVTVVCPECGVDKNRIIESRSDSKGLVDRRRHECACGVRWTSRAVLEQGTVATPISSVYKRRFNATYSAKQRPPDPICSVTPPTNSVGGVGGGVSSGQGSINLPSVPELITTVLSNPDQTRARTKNQAKQPSDFTRCRDAFVAAWEETYEAKYPFEAKDAAALSAMLKSHPEYAESDSWDGMISRYLVNEFYGQKRHPLVFLAAKAREFAGTPRNGVPQKIADSRETTRSWARRNVG